LKLSLLFAINVPEPISYFQITKEDYKIHIVLRSVTRKDAGKYVLTATNNSGKDVAETDISVLGTSRKSILTFHQFLKTKT